MKAALFRTSHTFAHPQEHASQEAPSGAHARHWEARSGYARLEKGSRRNLQVGRRHCELLPPGPEVHVRQLKTPCGEMPTISGSLRDHGMLHSSTTAQCQFNKMCSSSAKRPALENANFNQLH